ncbi:MAG: DNA repair protein RecN [Ferruginibacter sp.]|nr:DNA repair protein RecN [Ferruginibacter sp.]
MLQHLHIQNYAIIDRLEIKFSKGLNIITGETGAGKSILMGALNLILGQRADSSVLHQSDKKCFVEGVFDIQKNLRVRQFLQENELDEDDTLCIRREMAANGKSRSFINDTPVTLSQVKALSIYLVDLHQQFDTLDINTESFQREILDAYASNLDDVKELQMQYAQYAAVRKQLEQNKKQQADAEKEAEYNQFLFNELEELGLKENELEDLEVELKILNNAENIKQQLTGIYHSLKEDDQPLVQQLKSQLSKLKQMDSFHPDIEKLSERLSVSVIELDDIAAELEDIEQKVVFDAERIAIVNDRIAAGYKLLKKHGAQNTSQLLNTLELLRQKLDSVQNLSASIATLENEESHLLTACTQTANRISANRKKQAKPLAEKVNKLIAQVGMPNAQLKINITESPLSASGTDQIDFSFDANKSNKFELLGKVASGGELSRLMLSIKSLVAQKLSMPTLIFDEIDTGISGEAAKQVGIIMKDLAHAHQLIAITHQPQIAAMANAHYFVFKEQKGNSMHTSVRLLDEKERITVIAKMLGGEKPTAAAIENAREMVESRS